MTFIRTLNGDIDPADLGPTYAHEHLVIDGGRPVELQPDFDLGDVDKAVEELTPARELGLASIVEAMPCSAGRNVRKLVEIGRRTGIHVVGPTGLHLAKYYADDHWSHHEREDELAERFIADVALGIDANDYLGADIDRTEHRAGVVKAAGSAPALTPLERRVFAATAETHVQTGVPVLTHCTDGLGGLEQVAFLAERGVDPRHVVLSHTDKVVDRGYHREIMATGANVEYDQGFRWPDGHANGTLTLLEWMLADGFGDRLMLGLDAARRGYWRVYGGSPGWAFLLGTFADAMLAHGIDAAAQQRLFVTNPARAYTFAEPLETP